MVFYDIETDLNFTDFSKGFGNPVYTLSCFVLL